MISILRFLFFCRESLLKKDFEDDKNSLQKSIATTSALITDKDKELEKLKNEVQVVKSGKNWKYTSKWGKIVQVLKLVKNNSSDY